MSRVVGIPIKLLHESVSLTCTIELKSGDVYRGLVVDVEDNWNIQMQAVVYTDREGKNTKLDNVYIRGSQIRFVILPDMLKHSPIFTRFTNTEKKAEPEAKKMRA